MSNQSQKKNDSAEQDLEQYRALEDQIRGLKEKLSQFEHNKGGLDSSDLVDLGKIGEDIEFRDPLVDRLYKKKGIMYSMYVKMPLRILNLASLSQSQKFMRDTYRSVTSPLCVMCNKGILMHKDNQVPINGEVRWFCSQCTYQVWAKPASKDLLMFDVREKIGVGMDAAGKDRWAALSDNEKTELIDSHSYKSRMFRVACVLLTLLAFAELIFQLWWALVVLLPVIFYTLVESLRWAYRAWQIKTGILFEPQSFFDWLQNAEKYYSLDWVDQKNNEEGGTDA